MAIGVAIDSPEKGVLKNRTMQTGLENVSVGNKMYDDLFKANPYTNLTYNQSGWQQFLSKIGFRTDFDRWKEEAQVNKNEYDAQIASIMQQNQFNSPEEQSQRMRDAGMNPDLLGTNGVSDSASPVQDVNGMSPNVGDELSNGLNLAKDFASGVLGLFQIAEGIAKDVFTFQQLTSGVANNDINLAKNFMGFMNDYVLANSPAEPFVDENQASSFTTRMMDTLQTTLPRQLHLSRRSRRIWNSISREYFNSDDFKKMTANWKESAQNLEGFSRTSKPFNRYMNDRPWTVFNHVSSQLGDLADEVYRIQQDTLKSVAGAGDAKAKYDKSFYDTLDPQVRAKADNAKSNYELSFNSALDPDAVAQAQNDSARLTSSTAQIEKAINSTMRKMVTTLERDANNGDRLASALLLAFNIFRMSNLKIK